MSIGVIGCGIVVVLSMVADPRSTIVLITNVVGVRGVTWLGKKIVSSMNTDMGQLINFAGWCIAGVNILKIIENAMVGVKPVVAVFEKVGNGIEGIGIYFNRFAEIVDKITFWN